MAKRSRPVIPVHWYLREWMDTLLVTQRDMCERAGWSKTSASLLYNHQQDFNVDLLKSAARALNIEMHELLMHPSEAMAIRRVRENALRIAAERRTDFNPNPVGLPQRATR